MGASLSTVAGRWEGYNCGLLGGGSKVVLAAPVRGEQAGCGGKVGLFLMGSVCGMLSSEEGLEQGTHSFIYLLIQTFYKFPLLTITCAGTGAHS